MQDHNRPIAELRDQLNDRGFTRTAVTKKTRRSGLLMIAANRQKAALFFLCAHINTKPHDDRRASQDRHIAVASFRRVTATSAGALSPALG